MGKRKARLTSAQIQDIKRYCKENGYNLRKGLSDLGISLRLYYLSIHEKSEQEGSAILKSRAKRKAKSESVR